MLTRRDWLSLTLGTGAAVALDRVQLLEQRHPDVVIYTPVIDRHLNAHKFIVPGLGDFGDRLYGTR